MAKKSITCEINKELAAHIAGQIVKGLGEFPPDEAASVLNGIQVALMYIATKVAEHQTEKGMVEKLISFCRSYGFPALALNAYNIITSK